MSVPLIPPPLDVLRNRPFSFYPAILNIEHNKWRYCKHTWSEALVVNVRTGQEVWIQRRFLGEVARIEDPVVIVGLLQELEYKDGAVAPYQRRVIEMPVAVGARTAPPAVSPPRSPAPVVAIRLEPKRDSQLFRFVGGALVLGIVAAYCVVNFYREIAPRPRFADTIKDRAYLELTAADDADAVVRRLGPATHDRWQSGAGATSYRALEYADRGYTVILMGADPRHVTYIGTLDRLWKPLHSVATVSADAILRGLSR